MGLLSFLTSNIIDTDSYKVAHWSQYPEGTEYVSSYIESRGSKFAEVLGDDKYKYAEFVGLQAFLKEHLSKPVTQDDVDLAELLFEMHGEPFNKAGWQYIVDHHGGKLPLEIKAMPEGTVAATGNVMVQVVNTDPKCFWLTSYVETALLRAVWYPTTVATKSRLLKEICRDLLDETADDPSAVLDFMLHDFGARGNSSSESSAIGGGAHLANFKGTDTVMGVVSSLAYYDADYKTFLDQTPDNPTRAMVGLLRKMKAEGKPVAGFSVEASEHSTMTINGREGEKDQIKMMIDKAKKGGIISIVSDSYDYFNAVTNYYGGDFKQDLIEVGKAGGRVVIRPDSGDPVEVVTKTLEILEEKFGCTVNSKGFKALPPFVRVLQGDGIDLDSMRDILIAVKNKGYSVENVVFGMGGGLEQKVNRDDLKMAMKASARRVHGKWADVFKDPKTAQGSKGSKKGILALAWEKFAYKTIRKSELKPGQEDQLKTVFLNGEVLSNETLDGIRDMAEYTTALFRKPPTTPVPDPVTVLRNRKLGMAA